MSPGLCFVLARPSRWVGASAPLPALLGGPQPSSAVDGRWATVPGMLGRPIVVTATPTGAHWHVEIPGHPAITTRTLAMAETMTARRLTGAFDLQVRLGGLEGLCADAVDLGQAADAAHITALKRRRSRSGRSEPPVAPPSTSAT